jgi:branched-chain amino acid aminotransferase
MPSAVTWVDGTLCDATDATVAARDRGLAYGDGLFETMRAARGRVCFLDEHLARMTRGLATLRIDFPAAAARAREGIGAVVAAIADAPVASVKVIATRGIARAADGLPGSAPAGPGLKARFAPTVIVSGASDTRPRPESMRAITASVRRNERSVLAGVKSLNYLEMILARAEAEDAGVDEAVVLNTHRRVAEASAANVFALAGGALVTPSDGEGCLSGVVREAVCALARGIGADVTRRTLEPGELAAADEAFLTNSRIGVAALVELDGAPVGTGAVGHVTARIRRQFEALEAGDGLQAP